MNDEPVIARLQPLALQARFDTIRLNSKRLEGLVGESAIAPRQGEERNVLSGHVKILSRQIWWPIARAPSATDVSTNDWMNFAAC